MSEIKDKVKKQLSWVYAEIGTPSGNQKTYLSPDQINQILSIPELAIVNREAKLPEPYPNHVSLCTDVQVDMLKAGYVKEIKD